MLCPNNVTLDSPFIMAVDVVFAIESCAKEGNLSPEMLRHSGVHC